MSDEPRDEILRRRLEALGGDAEQPTAGDKGAARSLLLAEIERERSQTSRSRWRKRWSAWSRRRRMWVVAVAVVLSTGALAGANELRIEVFESSQTETVTLTLDDLAPGEAQVLEDAVAARGAVRPTTGDLDYCLRQDERGALDEGCALLLAAEERGEADLLPGPPSLIHLISCDSVPEASEVRVCEGRIDEADLENATDRDAG